MPVCSVFAKHCLYKTSHASHPTIVLLSICWDLTGLATPSRHVFLCICPSRTVFINRPRLRLRSFVCPLGFDRFSPRLITPRPSANVSRAYPLHVCVCVCVCVRACVRASVCLSHAPTTNVSRAYSLHVLLFLCICLFVSMLIRYTCVLRVCVCVCVCVCV